MLTGVYLPTDGSISINGKSIVGNKPYEVVKKGAARTFQNIRLFSDLSVLDNVKIAFQKEMSYGTLAGILRLPSYWKEEAEVDQKGRELLALFDMEDLADVTAKNLPYGQQRKLEIARALATNPKILMLDEPAAGMNPQETKELMKTIHFIREKFNIAILLIEHDMPLVMGICERIVVINYGTIIGKGTPDEIKNNPEVIKAYLGE
jgi:branched-chain amino acid transport system ATP-binding protein